MSGTGGEAMVTVVNALDLKTDARLLTALKGAARRVLTAAELKEQRVSFVYGSLDAQSDVTREQVREMLAKQEGVAEATS